MIFVFQLKIGASISADSLSELKDAIGHLGTSGILSGDVSLDSILSGKVRSLSRDCFLDIWAQLFKASLA